MNTSISIHYNTSVNHRSLSAYRVQVCETDATATGRFEQVGPVYNNDHYSTGVWETRADAFRELLMNIAHCRIVEYTGPGGTSIALEKLTGKITTDEFTSWILLARSTDKGIYIAAGA
jgi:hypothetical protein